MSDYYSSSEGYYSDDGYSDLESALIYGTIYDNFDESNQSAMAEHLAATTEASPVWDDIYGVTFDTAMSESDWDYYSDVEEYYNGKVRQTKKQKIHRKRPKPSLRGPGLVGGPEDAYELSADDELNFGLDGSSASKAARKRRRSKRLRTKNGEASPPLTDPEPELVTPYSRVPRWTEHDEMYIASRVELGEAPRRWRVIDLLGKPPPSYHPLSAFVSGSRSIRSSAEPQVESEDRMNGDSRHLCAADAVAVRNFKLRKRRKFDRPAFANGTLLPPHAIVPSLNDLTPETPGSSRAHSELGTPLSRLQDLRLSTPGTDPVLAGSYFPHMAPPTSNGKLPVLEDIHHSPTRSIGDLDINIRLNGTLQNKRRSASPGKKRKISVSAEESQ